MWNLTCHSKIRKLCKSYTIRLILLGSIDETHEKIELTHVNLLVVTENY